MDFTRSSGVGALRVAKENRVSGPSETRVTDVEASLAAISAIAASPAVNVGKRYPRITRLAGRRRTCTVASVISPRRPSLPRTISRTLGPVDVLGTGRVTRVPVGVTTRSPRVMSAMSP